MSAESFEHITRPRPIIKADAAQYIVFERRDVPEMVRFLEDFGFLAVDHEGETAYLRGHGAAPYLVALKRSDRNAFAGFAFAARSADDLDVLAAATGAKLEPAEGPGGGARVSLADPSGMRVDLIHGFTPVAPLETVKASTSLNTPDHKPRVNATVRPPLAPSPIAKLGHVVLQRPDFEATTQWYMRHFGIIPTDVQCLPGGEPALGFFRLNRGSEPADHHSVAILDGPEPRMLHVSFETFDLDSLGQGAQHLQARGWKHHWGIGRHVLGSQLFDYWKDPAGDEWEHYVDGDVMTEDYPTGYSPLTRGSLWAWGDDLPDDLRPPEGVDVSGGPEGGRLKGMMEALAIRPRPWLE